MAGHEINFDGIVGPTHNYAGLSFGNVASMSHKRSVSSPKQAALQGLAKMKFLHDLGVRQAVLPPQERPHLPTLRRLGFTGTDTDVLAKVRRDEPTLLAAVSSASSMWAANAATVSPSRDTSDGRVHFTPANLISNLHRSIEPATTARILRAIFADETRFAHHDPLPATAAFADEGAANHTRLISRETDAAIEFFTYGTHESAGPKKFPARQSLHACRAIARMHQLGPTGALFVRQNPDAIDSGAFHNDVVAVGHQSVLLYHALAWANAEAHLNALRQAIPDLRAIEIPEARLPLSDAIASYLFNSQLITLPTGQIALVAPVEARDNTNAAVVLRDLPGIDAIHFVDVRQSMHNGGGPACLRLRVTLTDEELAATHPSVLFTDALHGQLKSWIEKHYRDELKADDLADPSLLNESRSALDDLTRILRLPPIYDFQRS